MVAQLIWHSRFKKYSKSIVYVDKDQYYVCVIGNNGE